MSAGDLKDKLSSFFKVTAFLLGPYLKLKYQPKKDKSVEDYFQMAFIYTGSWLFVALAYVLFVYLFVFQNSDGHTGAVSDLFTRPPIDVLNDVITAFKVSPFFNLSFLVVMYFAITYHAEKTFLEERILHLNLSGLIKTLTLGSFDISSQIKEQHQDQVQVARANIYRTASDHTKELLSVVSASGWDLFGGTTSNTTPPKSKTQRWWQRWTKSQPNFDDGYLLPVISEQFRKVQIILLDPDCDAAKNRAQSYLQDGSHKPIASSDAYLNGIRDTISRIKTAYKKNKNIELRLIKSLPQWKIVIVEGEVWAQPIIPGVRSDHTPLYGFNKTEYSLYHSFWHLNENCWHNADCRTIDLSEQKEASTR